MTDLAGKRVATPQKGNTQDICRPALHDVPCCTQPDTSNVLPIANSDQAALMSRGDIDAAWDPEPWGTLLMKKTGATLVGEEKDLWPTKDFSLTVVVTSPEFLAAHPDIVAAVLKVNHNWTTKLAEHPDRYVDPLDTELAKLTGKKMPLGVTAEALSRIHFSDTCGPGTFESNAQWGNRFGVQPNDTGFNGVGGFVGDGEMTTSEPGRVGPMNGVLEPFSAIFASELKEALSINADVSVARAYLTAIWLGVGERSGFERGRVFTAEPPCRPEMVDYAIHARAARG